MCCNVLHISFYVKLSRDDFAAKGHCGPQTHLVLETLRHASGCKQLASYSDARKLLDEKLRLMVS